MTLTAILEEVSIETTIMHKHYNLFLLFFRLSFYGQT